MVWCRTTPKRKKELVQLAWATCLPPKEGKEEGGVGLLLTLGRKIRSILRKEVHSISSSGEGKRGRKETRQVDRRKRNRANHPLGGGGAAVTSRDKNIPSTAGEKGGEGEKGREEEGRYLCSYAEKTIGALRTDRKEIRTDVLCLHIKRGSAFFRGKKRKKRGGRRTSILPAVSPHCSKGRGDSFEDFPRGKGRGKEKERDALY